MCQVFAFNLQSYAIRAVFPPHYIIKKHKKRGISGELMNVWI